MSAGGQFEFDFPLHAIRQGRGFAAIVGEAPGLGAQQIPALFTHAALAEQFLAQTKGQGEIEAFHDAEQFASFLRSLPSGMRYVAFDPRDGYSPRNVLISQLL